MQNAKKKRIILDNAPFNVLTLHPESVRVALKFNFASLSARVALKQYEREQGGKNLLLGRASHHDSQRHARAVAGGDHSAYMAECRHGDSPSARADRVVGGDGRQYSRFDGQRTRRPHRRATLLQFGDICEQGSGVAQLDRGYRRESRGTFRCQSAEPRGELLCQGRICVCRRDR